MTMGAPTLFPPSPPWGFAIRLFEVPLRVAGGWLTFLPVREFIPVFQKPGTQLGSHSPAGHTSPSQTRARFAALGILGWSVVDRTLGARRVKGGLQPVFCFTSSQFGRFIYFYHKRLCLFVSFLSISQSKELTIFRPFTSPPFFPVSPWWNPRLLFFFFFFFIFFFFFSSISPDTFSSTRRSICTKRCLFSAGRSFFRRG